MQKPLAPVNESPKINAAVFYSRSGTLQRKLRPSLLTQSSTGGCPFHNVETEEEIQTGVHEEIRMAPGPRPLSLRSAWDVSKILRFGIHEAMHRFFESYGPICRFANPTNLNGKSGWLFVNIPNDIQHICSVNNRNYTARYLPDIYRFITEGKGILCSQGEYNRKHRAMCQPTFHSKPLLKKFSEKVVRKTERVIKWLAEADVVTDITLVTQRLSLDIIGDVAFSHDFRESEKIRKDIQNIEIDYSEDTDDLVKAVNIFGDVLADMFILPIPVLKVLDRVNFPRLKELKQAVATQRKIMLEVITQRRSDLSKGHQERNDLLGSLLKVYDEDGNKMTDEELWEDVHDIMGAGHETTASALSALLYLIAVHPEVEKKLIHELKTVLNGRSPTIDDYENLVYTNQCVKEMLRMYPPIPIFPREASSPDVLPSGHGVKQGDVVFMSGYTLGRSTEIWQDPMVFLPERFDPILLQDMHKFQYCPFGAGNRMCIGPVFAQMSVTLMTAAILQKLKFTAVSPTERTLDIGYDITMNFYKSNGLKMRVTGRN
eukprot:g6946.t1